MENISFSFQNILNENGIIISIMGMLIVFLSLATISIIIKYLPRILVGIDYLKNRRETKVIEESNEKSIVDEIPKDSELYAAICAAIALEIGLSNFGDDQLITLKAGSEMPTAWATVGKLRTLSSRIAS